MDGCGFWGLGLGVMTLAVWNGVRFGLRNWDSSPSLVVSAIFPKKHEAGTQWMRCDVFLACNTSRAEKRFNLWTIVLLIC